MEDARKLLDRRLKELWAESKGLQPFTERADKIYMDELLDELEKDYKLRGRRGLKKVKTHLKPIRHAFGDLRAVMITAKMVDTFIDRRLEEDKVAPGTVNRQTQLLGQAFKLAIKRGQIAAAPH